MIDQERDLLAEYSKETNSRWTLMHLIDDHRYLVAQRAEVETEAKEAEVRGFREGFEYGLRSAEHLNELTRREE